MATKVTGPGGSSDAQGTNPKPWGVNSHAEGKGTLASNASAHAEGQSTIASGLQAHAEGQGTNATADQAHSEGYFTTASGITAHAEGYGPQATGDGSHAGGRYGLAKRLGQWARGVAQIANLGDAQYSILGLTQATSDATPTLMTSGDIGTSAVLTGATCNVWTVPVSRANKFRLEVIARNASADEFGSWTVTGAIVRHSSGSARFISTPTVTADKDAAASAWDLAVSVNTGNSTNNYLAVTATGEAAKAIRWVGTLYVTEVG